MKNVPKQSRHGRDDRISLTLTARQKIVLAILKERGGLSAQEIADTLCFLRVTPTNERNFAAPRLTELCDMGLVKAVRKKVCQKTRRTVTVWAAVKKTATPPPNVQIQCDMRAWLDSLERGGGKRKQHTIKKMPGRNMPSALLQRKHFTTHTAFRTFAVFSHSQYI